MGDGTGPASASSGPGSGLKEKGNGIKMLAGGPLISRYGNIQKKKKKTKYGHMCPYAHPRRILKILKKNIKTLYPLKI